jgi:hypothetical protein
LASWQVSDWNDPTTAVQRTQALVDLGLLSSAATPPQVLNASQANVAFVTPVSASSSISPGTQIPYPAKVFNQPYPGDGGTVSGYTGSTPVLAVSAGTWFVIDSNNQAWKVDSPFSTNPVSTTLLAYVPTAAEITGYQLNRQSWVTSLGQMSQDSQLILQSTTALFTQSIDAASNIQEGKAQSKEGVAKNFA